MKFRPKEPPEAIISGIVIHDVEWTIKRVTQVKVFGATGEPGGLPGAVIVDHKRREIQLIGTPVTWDIMQALAEAIQSEPPREGGAA